MATKPLPSPEVLRQLLRYEPETGDLFWKPRPASMFPDERATKSWNTRYAEKPACIAVDGKGYLQGAVFGQLMRAHRVIWALAYGEWPADQIDHANGVRTDNRLSNLREATRSQNQINRKAPAGGGSRYRGVYWCKRRLKWAARVKVNGTNRHLGYFQCEDEAARAYDVGAAKHFGEYARLNSG